MLHFLVSLCVALRLFYYLWHKKRLPEINQAVFFVTLLRYLNLLYLFFIKVTNFFPLKQLLSSYLPPMPV